MSLLYGRVGLIVALSQMIEYSLAEIQAYHKALSIFDSTTKVEKRKFHQIVDEANALYAKSIHKSLGQNIAQAKNDGLFKENASQLAELEDALKERNYVTHQLFKDDVNDSHIEKDTPKVLERLLHDVERLKNINDVLLIQVDTLKKDYDSIG